MTGNRYFIINIASLCAISGGIAYFGNKIVVRDYRLQFWFDFLMTCLNPNFDVPILVYVLLAILLFSLGTLLPHMDDSESFIARYIYLPIGSGTWSHAIWLPLLFFMSAPVYSLCFWVGFGYILHLFWDNASDYGVCLCYPFSKYLFVKGVAPVKQKHTFCLYRTGGRSEDVLFYGMLIVAGVGVYFGVTSCFTNAAF